MPQDRGELAGRDVEVKVDLATRRLDRERLRGLETRRRCGA
jgi:hypothetical protein